jgi:hypothetical protein
VDEDFVEVIDMFDGDPAVFRIQSFAHLMPSLTQLAEIHVLDLRVAHREDAAKATALTHWKDVFDHSDETPARESAFPAHGDRRNLNSHWVHRAIYISPQGPSGMSLTMPMTSCAQCCASALSRSSLEFWNLELTNLTLVLAAVEGFQQNSPNDLRDELLCIPACRHWTPISDNCALVCAVLLVRTGRQRAQCRLAELSCRFFSLHHDPIGSR